MQAGQLDVLVVKPVVKKFELHYASRAGGTGCRGDPGHQLVAGQALFRVILAAMLSTMSCRGNWCTRTHASPDAKRCNTTVAPTQAAALNTISLPSFTIQHHVTHFSEVLLHTVSQEYYRVVGRSQRRPLISAPRTTHHTPRTNQSMLFPADMSQSKRVLTFRPRRTW